MIGRLSDAVFAVECADLSIAGVVRAHLAALRSTGYADATVACRRLHLQGFLRWSRATGTGSWSDVDEGVLERYREFVSLAAGATAGALARSTIHARLAAVRLLCAWAVRTGRASRNPAIGWTLPRLSRLLPRAVLSTREVERVLGRPDLTSPLGLRDRAIMELLYSTGMRRAEAVALDVGDIQRDRHAVFVREGKGRKDRVVPIGARALDWVARYEHDVRDHTPGSAATPALFLSMRGTRIRPNRLTERLHAYVMGARLGKSGSCHVFRHTMATLMHDRGADIRDLQEMLGHAELGTTQIYTHVSVERLRRVHARTHPAEAGWKGKEGMW